MLFHVIAAVASVAFIAQGALAQVTQQQTVPDIVNNIDQAVQIAKDTMTALLGTTELTDQPQVETSAQNLEEGLNDIAQNINSESTKIQATASFTDCTETEPIVNALSNAVGALQELLELTIGKQTIFAQYELLDPIAAALENLEAAIDSSAKPTITLLPTCDGNNVIDDVGELDGTLGDAIKLYKEDCVPSPLYPSVRPVCVAPL